MGQSIAPGALAGKPIEQPPQSVTPCQRHDSEGDAYPKILGQARLDPEEREDDHLRQDGDSKADDDICDRLDK
nr:hypothetical protein [Bauldia litoralis]